MPSPGKYMSRILAHFDDAKYLFLEVLNNVDPVVVVHGCSIARNGGGVAVVIDDASLADRPLCEGQTVSAILPNAQSEKSA